MKYKYNERMEKDWSLVVLWALVIVLFVTFFCGGYKYMIAGF